MAAQTEWCERDLGQCWLKNCYGMGRIEELHYWEFRRLSLEDCSVVPDLEALRLQLRALGRLSDEVAEAIRGA